MPEKTPDQPSTLALSTKVEEDFVAPLTAVRGALEILRDHPDLGATERERFVSTALRSCRHLESAVTELAETVYAAGQQPAEPQASRGSAAPRTGYGERVMTLDDLDIMEVDFSNLVFANSQVVNEVHDAIEAAIKESGRKWYFLINFEDCSVWPEAWVAFAHRGKKINVNHSLGTVRYSSSADGDNRADLDPDLYASREMALERIEEIKGSGAPN